MSDMLKLHLTRMVASGLLCLNKKRAYCYCSNHAHRGPVGLQEQETLPALSKALLEQSSSN